MKKYKSCQVCGCKDCKTGTYRKGSWYCPLFKKQICDICCDYDMRGKAWECLELNCKHLKEN